MGRPDQEAHGEFCRVTHFNAPYPHQVEVYEALKENESVVLRAPTGSGKSEAVFVPFLKFRGKSLPFRMIYTLPMRALVDSLARRLSRLAPGIRVRAQHGQRPESVLFYADAIIATLDQVVTSYACVPLTLGIRQGNIPAGAVVSSLLVFDEVHTFEPALGLQSMLILADRLRNMFMPFVIMSATLPSSFIEGMSERLGARIVEVEEEDIPVRAERNLTLRSALKDHLSPEAIMKYHSQSQGRTLVVCNTVGRAVEIYSQLRSQFHSDPLLIHSRFLEDDRSRREVEIANLFGKDGSEKALLISTQVIEVGMDISCDLLLTELAPIDALIQRAGRCARWGGEGEVVVFGTPDSAPYYSDKEILTKTADAINEISGGKLSWNTEKELVDRVLEEKFRQLADIKVGAKAMSLLSQAAFEGRPSLAERAVRDSLSVEVSIHNAPEQLSERVFLLPRLKLHPSVLKAFIQKQHPLLWCVEQDRTYLDDYYAKVDIARVSSPKEIYPGGFFILHNDFASYSSDRGLVFGEKGEPLAFLDNPQIESRSGKETNETHYESWQEHSLRTLEAFERFIAPKEGAAYIQLASFLEVDHSDVLLLLKVILLLHDLGKLSQEWQCGIGAKGEFLAHLGGNRKVWLPPHATVSAYILQGYLRKRWGSVLGQAATLAIAHHHSVRAGKIPRYRLSKRWYDIISEILSELVDLEIPWDEVKELEIQPSPTELSLHFPAFEKPKIYTSYVLLARTLRLSDRIATGGSEDAVLCYEERLGSL